jgi:hypothetical protein
VTYWNHLGWSDPYSWETYTQRQNDYSARFNLESVFTPQMVINGREEIVGSDAAALNRALMAEVRRPLIHLQNLSTQVAEGKLHVHFSARPGDWSQPLKIMAAITDDAARSNALHGESSGRVLQHSPWLLIVLRRTFVQFLVARPFSAQQTPNAVVETV